MIGVLRILGMLTLFGLDYVWEKLTSLAGLLFFFIIMMSIYIIVYRNE